MLISMGVTEASRQLGFLRFHSIPDSRDFLARNHPFIHLYGPTGEKSTKVRIAYSREREDRVRAKAEGDWTCRMVSFILWKLSLILTSNLLVCRCELLHTREMFPV